MVIVIGLAMAYPVLFFLTIAIGIALAVSRNKPEPPPIRRVSPNTEVLRIVREAKAEIREAERCLKDMRETIALAQFNELMQKLLDDNERMKKELGQ
jgi:hypothetical protein